MNIKSVRIAEIQRAKYNPRKALKPGDPAYDRLKKAVTTFGLVEPLVWNERTGNLVGGHQRLSILEEQGDTEVEVSVVNLSERDEKVLNVALNKQGGEWDFATLADILQELDAGDIDMEITGFDQDELERMMTWTAPNTGLTDEDAVPPEPTVATTRLGDVWALGPHRLACGDSTSATDVARLLGDVAPGIMVTDPPYGVAYDPEWRARAGVNKNKQKMGLVQNDTRVDWKEAYILFPGNVAYVWHAGRYAAAVQVSLEASGFETRSQIIWAKDRLALSRGHYHWQHEPCWYAVKKGTSGTWTGDRSQTTLWQIKSRDDSGHGHGTQKPVECMRRPIVNHTNPGQAVYDPFVGSGTTLIAAESTGRTCYAMEIDPFYCDVVIKRWELFAGKQAALVP